MKLSLSKPRCLDGHIAISLLSLIPQCDKFCLRNPVKIYKTASISKFEPEDYICYKGIHKMCQLAELNLDDSVDFGISNAKDLLYRTGLM
jgi:hypothetical protein